MGKRGVSHSDLSQANALTKNYRHFRCACPGSLTPPIAKYSIENNKRRARRVPIFAYLGTRARHRWERAHQISTPCEVEVARQRILGLWSSHPCGDGLP
jgi:hypothetical protein